MFKLKGIALFCLGVVVGWVLKPAEDRILHEQTSTPLSPNAGPVYRGDTSLPENIVIHVEQDVTKSPTEVGTTEENLAQQNEQFSFKDLLNSRKYEQAILVFQQAENATQAEQKELRSILLDHLNLLLKQDRDNDFIDLTNLYLASYFEDIDVLLLLAEFNKDANLYIEAVGVYQLATEYAYSLKSQQKIEQAFEAFLRETDAFLSQQEDWYNLSQVFFQAELVGLLVPKYRLRQAEVYLLNGERYEATQVLNSLLSDKQFSKSAKDLLDHINGNTDNFPQDSIAQNHASALALEKSGNQYIAGLGLSETVETRLLIDTGASLTTLSLDAFNRVRGQMRYDYAGERMFSTANGLIKGQVYTVDVVSIANYSLENTAIAVLDFGMHGGIDGLLGMNVLGKFRFQIDQDKSQLLLSPR